MTDEMIKDRVAEAIKTIQAGTIDGRAQFSCHKIEKPGMGWVVLLRSKKSGFSIYFLVDTKSEAQTAIRMAINERS